MIKNYLTLSRPGIYSITHESGKQYVGSATNIWGRWAVHQSLLRAGRHHSKKLQRAWDKYGDSTFTFDVIEFVDDLADLIPREQFYITERGVASQHGYNISPTAGNTLGRKHTEEARKKISEKAMGRKASEETRKRMSERRQNLKRDKPHSLETRMKIAEKARGRIASDETKKKMSEARQGRKLSDSHRAKLAEQSRARAKIPISEETRARMSASAKERAKKQIEMKIGIYAKRVNPTQGSLFA